MFRFKPISIFYPYFENFTPLDEPPTLFKILDSIINGDKPPFDPDRVPTYELSKVGRKYVFDFEYNLTENINKEDFEINFIDHFLMRRIGMETFNAFKIQLRSRFRELIPFYNLKFDMLYLSFADLFEGDGYELTINENERTNGTENGTENGTYSRESSDTDTRTVNESKSTETESDTTTTNTTSVTDDKRHSDTPQSQLSNIRDGSYVTDYNYDQSNGSQSGTVNLDGSETVSGTTTENDRKNGTIADETEKQHENSREDIRNLTREEIRKGTLAHGSLLLDYYSKIENVYSEFYHDCDSIFYQLWN